MKKILIAIIGIVMLCCCCNPQAKDAGDESTTESMTEDLDAQYAVDLLKPGVQVPELTLNDLRGNARSLSEFRGKKVVLVFWASWCPDCRAEAPELRAMQAAADPEKVAFVSVSFDRDFETLCKYVEENFLGGVQLFDPAGKKESKAAADFGVKWIPSLYLIDEEGKVVVSTVVAAKIAAALNGSTPDSVTPGGVCTDEGCCVN